MATYTIKAVQLPNGDLCNIIDTTYSTATESTDGLMSSSDKTKLNTIDVATLQEVKTYLGIS